MSTIFSPASKIEKQFEEPLVSILEPKFKNINNGEEKIYVSASMEILSSDPIYDEYSDKLEKRPFESTCIEFFSRRLKYDIYGDSESDDVWSPNQCTVCLFEQQFPKRKKLISFILEIEFQGNIKPNVLVGYFRDHGGNFQFYYVSSPTVQKKFDVINETVIPHKQEDVVVTYSRFASSNNSYDPVACYMEAKESDKSCVLHLLST